VEVEVDEIAVTMADYVLSELAGQEWCRSMFNYYDEIFGILNDYIAVKGILDSYTI
jgi:hypothetical protein